MEIQDQANSIYKGEALAPMVRASTTPLRTLSLQYGADFCYTEELVDRSITDTMRVKNDALGTIDYVKDVSKLSKKTQRKLQRDNNRPCLILRIDPKLESSTNKLVCQLGSGEPELALPAAKHVYKDVAAIDINMGCPKKFSVSGGMGSALLKDPERASRIVKTLRAEIPRPVSVKIRLLPTIQETIDFCHAMVNAGANAIAIHARRPGTDSTVNADWESLEEVLGLLRPKYPDIPLLVNGDFYEREERRKFMDRTQVNGFLLGRPALYNTSTFLPMQTPLVDKTKVVQEYLRHSMRYEIHYKNAKYVICEMMNNRRAPTDRVPFLPQVFNGWSTSAKLVKEMTPGEHRYEDSYFLKRDQANGQVLQSDAKRSKTSESASEENGFGNSTPKKSIVDHKCVIARDENNPSQKSSKFQCSIH
eukprot:scaffold1327_cov124-Cylindrotheca_fusiformis.AAC.11